MLKRFRKLYGRSITIVEKFNLFLLDQILSEIVEEKELDEEEDKTNLYREGQKAVQLMD